MRPWPRDPNWRPSTRLWPVSPRSGIGTPPAAASTSRCRSRRCSPTYWPTWAGTPTAYRSTAGWAQPPTWRPPTRIPARTGSSICSPATRVTWSPSSSGWTTTRSRTTSGRTGTSGVITATFCPPLCPSSPRASTRWTSTRRRSAGTSPLRH